MLQFLDLVQQDGIDFVADTIQNVDISRDNILSRIRLKIFVNVTTGGVTPPTADRVTSDVVKLIALALPKNNFKMQIDLTKYIFKEEIQRKKPVVSDATLPTAINTTKTLYWYVDLDFKQDVTNKTDVTALLNAPALDSLKLNITWGDVNDMTSTPNGMVINAAASGVSIETTVVYDDDPKAQATFLNSTFVDIREGISVFPVDRQYQSFTADSLNFDLLPVPAQILQQVMLTKINTQTQNGTPSDAVMTDLLIKDVRGAGRNILNRTYDSLNAETKSLFGDFIQRSGYVGVINLDYLDMFHVGILNVNQNAIKLEFLTDAPTGTTVIECYTKYISGL